MTDVPIRIEEKLYQNRYLVDEGRPHIRIKDAKVCLACAAKTCTRICPAGCYSRDETGSVTAVFDGCLECGTCRIICADQGNIDWFYPRGGFGILYKFG